MKEIPLTQGKVALVDDEDFERLVAIGKWCAVHHHGNWYAKKNIENKNTKLGRALISMHRLIMNASQGLEVDHRDGNGLNNQKNNLRVCTRNRNAKNRKIGKNNTSGYKGVNWEVSANKWRARVKVDRNTIHIGLFHCPIEAAKAYNEAAIKHHGEFAKLNQI